MCTYICSSHLNIILYGNGEVLVKWGFQNNEKFGAPFQRLPSFPGLPSPSQDSHIFISATPGKLSINMCLFKMAAILMFLNKLQNRLIILYKKSQEHLYFVPFIFYETTQVD